MNLVKVRAVYVLASLSSMVWLPATGNAQLALDFTNPMAEAPLESLLAQGVLPGAILGIDQNCIPGLCGTGMSEGNISPAAAFALNGSVPAGMRSWEPVPGIIRNDGLDAFRLEVDVNGPVRSVVWQGVPYSFRFMSGTSPPHVLRDDGLSGDRVAGDYIFTSEPVSYNTNIPLPSFLWWSSNSPPGLFAINIAGQVEVVELNGQTNRFLRLPYAGVLDVSIPPRSTFLLSSNIIIASHLININTSSRDTQKSIRYANTLPNLTRPIFSVLPDAFDFGMFFSTDHLEFMSTYDSRNYITGTHYSSKINFGGTGQGPMDNTAAYGSHGRLLGLNILDAYWIYSWLATHELVHQWAAFIRTSFGLTDGTGHYERRSNVGSFVGGGNWIDQGNGTFIKDCDYRRQAPTLDKYMMGLISGASVAPLMVSANFVASCGGVISNIVRSVTIGEIQGLEGIRTPGPQNAQRDFSMAFVAESYGRFLTPVEITFYDILAEHYTKAVLASEPDPDLTIAWASITRYFGEGTTWRSDILRLIQPRVTLIERLPGSPVEVAGKGYPGGSYSLQASTNLMRWSTITSGVASPDGSISLTDTNSGRFNSRFYRVSTP